MSLRRVLYTAEASTDGGREGVVRSSDGRLEVSLSVPVELRGGGGNGTNPEQLFAAGYAACYQSALFLVAAGRKIDITGSRVTVRVGLGPPAPEVWASRCRSTWMPQCSTRTTPLLSCAGHMTSARTPTRPGETLTLF